MILSTGIGSLPHHDPEEALQFVVKNFPEIPFWPQLPKRGFRENMYAQYSEGLASVKIDESNKKIYFQIDEENTEELEGFYERIISDNVDSFKITEEYASGLHSFFHNFNAHHPSPHAIKGQITGPVSFGLTVTDQNRRALFYHEQFRDVLVRGLSMKARWQVRQLKKIFPEVILFIDEPYLASYGSAFVSLQREEVVASLNEFIRVIRQEGAKSGIHCCGNTDWSLLMDTEVEIISFDAYEYFDSFVLYAERVKEFLSRGGVVSWGLIPASEKVNGESRETIKERFKRNIQALGDRGIQKEKLMEQSLLTPSCGTGTLPVQLAEKVLTLTRDVSMNLAQ